MTSWIWLPGIFGDDNEVWIQVFFFAGGPDAADGVSGRSLIGLVGRCGSCLPAANLPPTLRVETGGCRQKPPAGSRAKPAVSPAGCSSAVRASDLHCATALALEGLHHQ